MIKKTKTFMNDVQTELKKVNWPEREQLVNSTFVVFVISALFTLFVFATDSVVSFVVNFLY